MNHGTYDLRAANSQLPYCWAAGGYRWFTWIAGGSLLVAALTSLLGPPGVRMLNVVAPLLALLFSLAALLLLAQFGRLGSSSYARLGPKANASLRASASLLGATALLAALWLVAGLLHRDALTDLIRWPAALAGLATAASCALGFRQEDRSGLRRRALLLLQSFTSAVVAGSSSLLTLALLPGASSAGEVLVNLLTLGLLAQALALIFGLYWCQANADPSLTSRLLTAGPLSPIFWRGVVYVGLAVPLAFLAVSGGRAGPFAFLAGLAVLAGLLIYDVLAVQAVELLPGPAAGQALSERTSTP